MAVSKAGWSTRWPLIGAVLGAIVIASVATVAVVNRGSSSEASEFKIPTCTESSTVECLRNWTVDGSSVQA